MAVYREQVQDSRWRVAHEQLSEEQLPEHVQRAFQAFERRLSEIGSAEPRQIDLELGSEVETYYPAYDSMKVEGMFWAVAMALFVWIMGVGVSGLVAIVGLFVLPDHLMGPVMLGVLGLGAVVVGIWAFRTVWTTWQHNRVKRAARRRIAYGAFLLSDAIVLRYPGWAGFFPRDCVQAAEVERDAAQTVGGNRTSVRHVGPQSELHFRYLSMSGESQKKTLLTGLPGHEPAAAVRLRAWIQPTAPAQQDPSFQHAAADLQREDYARAWRSFKRRGRAATVLLIAPWLLFLTVGFVDGCRETNMLDEVFGPGVGPLFALLIGPGVIAYLLYRFFRCPRCGKSPRQPLRGTDVSRCLSCGLPIFTKAKAPGPSAGG